MVPPFDPELEFLEIEHAFNGQLHVIEGLTPGGQGALFLVEMDSCQKVLKIYKNAHTVRAERESLVLEKIKSQEIVNLYKWGTVEIRGEECIYTLTEFIDGTCLREIIQIRPLDEKEATLLGYCIATAIELLWSNDRIVHRDIKPSNIMIKKNGKAVLLDLGIAKHKNLTTVTSWGVSWGTEGYKSPEQARARRGITYKSDFFSLGIVLFEALTQKHPYNYRQDLIGKSDPPELISLIQVSPALSKLVNDLMANDPLDRPPNPQYLIDYFGRKI